MQRVFLDTDIGDDIDDALALGILLNAPEVQLCGISTVFRDAMRRAELARHILHTFKRKDVAIGAGVSKPLLHSFAEVQGGAKLGSQFEILPAVRAKHFPYALDLMLKYARIDDAPNADKLTILAIGPLTNLALALTREPELISRCKIVLMGGDMSGRKAEWNIRCDPEAAAIVFESGADISMIGLDVTELCRLSQQQVEALALRPSPQAKLLAQLTQLWMRDTKFAPILHDPLAALTLFSDCVTFEEKRIEIGLCGDERGKTLVREGAPNVRVGVQVDAERAVAEFMARMPS